MPLLILMLWVAVLTALGSLLAPSFYSSQVLLNAFPSLEPASPHNLIPNLSTREAEEEGTSLNVLNAPSDSKKQ